MVVIAHGFWGLRHLRGLYEDHFGKISSKQPSDGSIMVSELCEAIDGHILMAIGRHRFLRSIGATSLYTSVEAHVLTVSFPVRHVSTV